MNKMDNKSEQKSYEVLVEEVHLYSYTVVAKNEEEALEKYKDDEYDPDLVDCVKITRMDPYSCEEIPSKD